MVNLGDKVKDRISGLTGIATAIVRYISGCEQVSITPQEVKDGVPISGSYFDIDRIEVIEVGAIKLSNRFDSRDGGPQDSPRKS